MDQHTAAASGARQAKHTLVAQLQQCIVTSSGGGTASLVATTRTYFKLLSRIALALDYTATAPQPPPVSAEQLAREMLALQLAAVGHEDDDDDSSATTTIDSLLSHELHTLARLGAALRTLHNVRAERVVAAQLYLLLVAAPPSSSNGSSSSNNDHSNSGGDHRENGFARRYLTCVLTDGGGGDVIVAGADSLMCSDTQQTLDSVARHLNDTNRRDIICELASYIRDAHVIVRRAAAAP
jgi:hypothetical protein